MAGGPPFSPAAEATLAELRVLLGSTSILRPAERERLGECVFGLGYQAMSRVHAYAKFQELIATDGCLDTHRGRR